MRNEQTKAQGLWLAKACWAHGGTIHISLQGSFFTLTTRFHYRECSWGTWLAQSRFWGGEFKAHTECRDCIKQESLKRFVFFLPSGLLYKARCGSVWSAYYSDVSVL